MTTFARLQKQTQRFVAKLVEYSELDPQLVENIVQYARCLPKSNCSDIDENVFVAQLSQQFGLSSYYMNSQIYNALKGERTSTVTIESFCKCICTFLCKNLDTKIAFVFNVYDINVDNNLSFIELYTFLKPCILHTGDAEDVDTEESLRELIELVINVTDKDGNGEIELEEFRKLVKSNILYLQLLGPCLPTESCVESFKAKLLNKTPFEIRKEFEFERYRCLNDFIPKRESSLYPVVLEIP